VKKHRTLWSSQVVVGRFFLFFLENFFDIFRKDSRGQNPKIRPKFLKILFKKSRTSRQARVSGGPLALDSANFGRLRIRPNAKNPFVWFFSSAN
jgi:hypothetical protein